MKQSLLFFLLAALAFVPASAQNNLKAEYKNAASLPDFLNICGDADGVVVTVKTEGLSGAARANISAALQLFRGVEFVTLDAANTSPGVSVTNLANRNRPVFSLPNLSPSGTSSVQIAFSIAANCAYTDTIAANNDAVVFDTWTFTYNLGNQTGLTETDATEEYRTAFKVPTFTLTFDQNDPPAAKVGDCYPRTLTAANSALEGFVDTLVYTDVLGAGVSLKQLYVNGIAIPFTKTGTATDTTITAIIWGQWFQAALLGGGPGDGDVFLDPDERIVIREDICFVNCAKSVLSAHTIGWGCKGEICSEAIVNGFVRKGDGAPNALITNNISSTENVKVGYCKPGQYVIHFANNGSEIDPGFATMKDLEVQIGLNTQVLLKTTHLEITKIQIADQSVAPLATTTVLGGNPLFASDPDGPGGLEDVDGDGFFDDLRTGGTFDVLVDFEFDCDSANMIGMDSLCLNEFNIAWNAYLKYTDPCAERVTKSLPNFGGIQHSNEESINCIDPDAFPGQPFMVQHVETRGVRTFEKDCGGTERLVAWVKLPAGVTADVAAARLFKNNSTTPTTLLSHTTSNDTLYLFFDATSAVINGKYDFNLWLTPDCSLAAGRIPIPFGVYFSCPDCGCKHTWFCTVFDGPQFHPTNPPCSAGVTCPKGVQTTGFQVERTTFGFNSAAYTAPMNPANANKNVAIFCDTVKMTVSNVIGATPVTDSLGVVISYDNVDYLKDTSEIFLFQRGFVRIRKTGGQILNCSIDPALDLQIVRDDTTKTLTFRLDRCLTMLGTTLAPGDSLKFFGWFMVNPAGPMIDNFRKVPNLRAYGFAIFDGQEFACDNYGANFSVAKIPTVFAPPGGSEFPRGCSTTPFQYRLVTKNIGFSQFYTGGEFYPAVKVDSLVLDYDTAFLAVFQNLKVEVSIPGHPKFGNNFFVIPSLSAADGGHYVARFDTLARVPSYNAVTSYSFNLRMSVTPGCESLTGSSLGNSQFKMNPTLHYTDRFFAKNFGDGSCADERTDARTQNLTYSDPPTVSFEPVTNPNLLLQNDTAEWVIKQCNTSTKSDASQTWLAADFDTAQLQIIGFELIDNPALPLNLPLKTFGNGQIFALTPAVLRQAGTNTPVQICNTIRIRAILKQCGTFPIGLKMGWQCAAITDPNWTPDDYAPCAEETLELSVTALDPALDATVINQPAEYPSLCDTLSMDLLVRNTGQGPAFDVSSTFSIPLLGATLVPGSVEIAWPSDSTFQPALFDPTFVGNTLRGKYYRYGSFDSLHTGLAADGLPGFDALAPGKTNEFKLRYKFTTGCEFVGGVQTFYRFSGKKACGTPTNTESGESLPIQVAGISANGTARFEVGFGAGSILAAGGTSQLEIFAQNTTVVASDAQDKIQVKLPTNIVYQPGSSVAVQPSGWSPGNPQIQTVGGIQILTWTLPAGLLQNDTATLRFAVTTPALACNSDLEASVLTVRSINYSCPNGALTCPVNVLTTDGGEKFFDLNIGQHADFAGPDVQICPGGSAQLNATQPGFSDYSWSPAVSLDDPTIANPVASPSQTTTYTVLAIDQDGCANVDEITVSIGSSLMVLAGSDDASCGQNTGAVVVTVLGGSGNYTYQWSPSVSMGAAASNLAPGTYLVTVTDATNGCTDEAFASVNMIGSAVSVAATPMSATTVNPTSGKISLNITGGTQPFTIAWTGPVNGSQPAVNQPVFAIQNLTAGAYTVTVTDANGCSGTASATVLQDVIDNLSLVVSTQADTSCCVGKGVIFLTVGGGVGNYQFSWSPVPGAVAALGGGVFRVDDVEAGVYNVTVTDGSGLTRTASATVADACQCAEIFEDETVLVPSGVEAFCVGIPYLFIDYYPVYVNGKLYDGPVHPCDFDTVVYYAFSFLPGEGFDGPYKLQRWQGKGQVIENVVFQDLYDLTDSLNTWEPDGAWLLDDATSLIFGGDPFDQNEYGPMEITHLPTQSRFLVNTNYTGFAYGTEIFVEPFDGKVTITAYDSTTCCADSVCVIFVNPCEDLLPVEPFIAYTDAPTVCIPIRYDSLFNYFVFVDNLTVTGLAASCNSGAGSQVPVAGLPGFHEMIVIDTVRWCADTTPLLLIERPTPTTLRFTTQQGVPLANMCVQPDGQLGFSLDFNYCELPKNGTATQAQPGGLCFNYAPDAAFVGYDSMCVTLCDEYGICDTTLYIFEMKAGLPPLLTQRDTFYLTTQINTPINGICLPTNELQSAPTGLGFCSGPNHGVYIPTGVPCFNYMPNLDFAGIDQVCAFVCDATNTCDTAIFIIMVETPDTSGAMPNVDTVFISMPVNTPYTGLCLSTAELAGTVKAGVNSCAPPKHGQFLTTGATCLNFVPAHDFVGLDTACLFICDDLDKCDTTIVVIMVTPNDSTPDNHNIKFDVLQLTTLVNTPIAQTCLDLTELPGKPENMTILELPKFGFASPTGGNIGCFRYEPEKSYIGSDAMLIMVCDDLGLCDTTLVEIKILPDNLPTPTRDTLDFTVLENTTLSGICLDASELSGPGTAFEFCGGLAHGDLGTVGLPCFSYSPNTDFVGADEVCLVLCDAGGLCDTTLVRIQVLPDNPPPAGPTLDTLALTVFVNIPTGQICLDTSELTGALFGGPAICAFGQHGTFDFPGGSCFVYFPTPNYLGPDEACLFVCDDNGVCDTTILLIKVIDTQGSTTVDTIQLTTLENVPIILTCLDTTELPGNVAYMDFCGLPQNGTFTSLSASCFRFEPAPNFVGNDLGCIVVCDDAGVCDTTIVKITVQDNAQGPTPGFLVLTTPKNTPITAICLDESELNSSAVSFGFCGGQIYGTVNSVGVPCFEYTPSTDFVGDDFACVYICDATGLCDTTTLYITVTDIVNPPTPTVDTLRITTTENVPLPIICLSTAQLTGTPNDVIFCDLPQNGVFTATSDSCFSFTPNTDFVGQDTGCVIICDGQNVCDTTIIFITVLPDNGGPSPQIDTIRLTTLENVPLPNICGDTSEIGGPATSFDICDFPANGDVAGILAPCVTYSPNAGFTGQDTFCLVVCNDQTLLCDTTIFIITVQPDNGGPLPQTDTIRLTTLENTPLTNLCADVSEIGGPATSFDVCGSPANGSLTNVAAPCVGYEPNLDFVGQDIFCLVVCNDQTLLCDTTIFVITVQPDNGGPLPQIDTIRLTTLENVPLANLCADVSEIGGPATSFDVCGSPTNGSLTNIAAPCVGYEPNLDFVGQDTFCLVVCNSQTLLCDTTIFVITVQPDQTGSPTVDTLRLTTPENTPLPNICADLSQIGTATAMTICEQPANGTVVGVFPPCVSYSPNLDFVGVDTFCFFICNAQGLCDTSIVIVTVTDTTTANPNPEPDTIRITTNYQTVSDTFCLSTADLSGLVADLTFCGLPAHGTFAQIGDTCLTYTPDAGFVGNDTACVILCTANGTDCDTTIIILTVLPPGDCDIFAEDSISLEIPSTEQFGTICLDSFSLMNLLDFDFFDNGQPYANGFFGCNYDSCFAYTYFTVPDLGQIGPYRLDFWYFNGDTLTLPTFQNIAELADSIQAWDPQGGWQLDPSTLTIRTCSATWKNYGDIKITQLGTAGVAEIEINVNLQPQGTQIRLTPGQHLVTVFGPDCVDSLWVNVMVSNELVIDTFIYLDEPPGTICLDDLGINTASITDVQFLCPDASGTEVAFNFDATTNCLTFDGLAVGVDTFCLKLQLGTDSCFYLTVRVTVLEPLPCTGFIAASQLAAISPDCQEAEVCVDFPFALLSQYSVTDGSIAATTFACPANPQGVTETGFVLQGIGTHTLIFTKNSDPACADTVTVTVSCSVPGEFLVWIDTIFTGQTDSLCFDTTGKGAVVSMVNNCPGLSGQFVDFQLDTQAGCVFYTGVDDTGTDTACVVVCFANNQCDTVLLVVAVVPPTLPDSLLPIAVNDFDTLYDNSLQFIPVLANDTLNGLLTGIRILTQPSHGSVSLLQGGVLTYDPQLNYCNAVPDSLQYEICNPFGCDSAWVFIHRPCTEIKIYNGFSPNGDGMNEVFFIEGVQFFPGNFLQVFNRWGTLVFSQKDYLNTWRGTWNDQDLPDGVYFYVFDDGTGRIFKGHLMILR